MNIFYFLIVILLSHLKPCRCDSYDYYYYDTDTDNTQTLSTSEECARPCVDGAPPKTCYYKFRVEFYTTWGPACNFQKGDNKSVVSTNRNECVMGISGVEKTVFTYNRRIPGPSIQVCLGDRVVVDVANEAEGIEVTIHWHGIFQNGYQYYDGVPYITQCPITSETTFRYNFVVENSGTHFYHSHQSVFMIDGQYGSLIVRDPPRLNPHKALYDADLPDHVIVMSDYMTELSLSRFPGLYRHNIGQAAQYVLVNGRGHQAKPINNETLETPWETFTVEAGKRYRFRVINAFSTVCLSLFSIEGHSLLMIAQDGENIQPTKVNSVITASGERFDFVLYANQTIKNYWIQVRALGECQAEKVQQHAVLKYKGAPATPTTSPPPYNLQQSVGLLYNPLVASQCPGPRTQDTVCINQLKGVKQAPNDVLYRADPDYRIVMDFEFYPYDKAGGLQRLFSPGSYKKYFAVFGRSILLSEVNNISYQNSPGALISQPEAYETMCKPKQLSTCTEPCSCTQVYNIPLGALVEVATFDVEPAQGLSHPFHLHGYAFYVMTMGQFNRNITTADKQAVLADHRQRILNRQYDRPPLKDTITIPQGGYAIYRFRANNPGWWLYHCHFSWHTATGMNVVFHVGTQNDLPPVPPNFPKCYSWTPPI